MHTVLCKVTTCDTIYSYPITSRYNIMKIYPGLLSAEVQACIEPLLIPPIKREKYDVSECDIINIKMCWNLYDADLEMYELKIETFEHGQPEEFLALMKNFKTAIDGTGNKSAAVKINYLCNLLHGEALQ